MKREEVQRKKNNVRWMFDRKMSKKSFWTSQSILKCSTASCLLAPLHFNSTHAAPLWPFLFKISQELDRFRHFQDGNGQNHHAELHQRNYGWPRVPSSMYRLVTSFRTLRWVTIFELGDVRNCQDGDGQSHRVELQNPSSRHLCSQWSQWQVFKLSFGQLLCLDNVRANATKDLTTQIWTRIIYILSCSTFFWLCHRVAADGNSR